MNYYYLLAYLIVISMVFNNFKKSISILKFKLGKTVRNWKIDGKLLYVLLVSAPLVLLFVNRSLMVGSDTYNTYYLTYFLGYVVYNWPVGIYESLFIRLFKFCNMISYNDFYFILLIVSLIICIIFSFYFYAKRKSLNLVISMTIFYVWLYAPSLNIMRQILAVAICFLGLIFITKEKPMVASIMFICASFIHITSIVCFVFMIFYLYKDANLSIKYKFPIYCFIFSLALMLGMGLIIQLPFLFKFRNSLGSFELANINFKFFIYPLLTLVPVIPKWKTIIKASKFNFMFLSGFLLIITSCITSGFIWYMFRIMYFFVPSQILILSQVGRLYKDKGSRFIVNTYIVLVTIIIFGLVYIVWGVDGIYPYILK